jgi:hypothetical protein
MPYFSNATVMTKKTLKGRYELQADQEWLDRAEKAARRLGLSLAAYIRFVVTEDMDRRQQSEAQSPKK